jgi:hypothetical protein
LASLSFAIDLLAVLRRPEAIPELIEIVENYCAQPAADAVNALIEFGAPGFDALINLCSSPSITGYRRSFAIQAATDAAGNDPDRRSRLAPILRPMLDEAIAKAKEELKSNGVLQKLPPDADLSDIDDDDLDLLDETDDDVIDGTLGTEEDDLAAESQEVLPPNEVDDDDEYEDDDEDDDEPEPFNAEALGYVVDALAAIADPLARDSILSAFDEGLVDEQIVTRESVLEQYDGDAESPEEEPDFDWLEAYREDHAKYAESPSPSVPLSTTLRPKYRYQDRYDEGEPPPDVPVTEPIRNSGPRLRRNDPCWCGSGKKYKKCHLGKEGTR